MLGISGMLMLRRYSGRLLSGYWIVYDKMGDLSVDVLGMHGRYESEMTSGLVTVTLYFTTAARTSLFTREVKSVEYQSGLWKEHQTPNRASFLGRVAAAVQQEGNPAPPLVFQKLGGAARGAPPRLRGQLAAKGRLSTQ